MKRLGFFFGIVAAVAGCSKTICGGGRISCGAQDVAICESVAGCKAQPECQLESRETRPTPCAAASREADCGASRCTWTACVDRCSTIHEEGACGDLHSPERDAFGGLLWSCRWVRCSGKAEQSCGDFFAEECPIKFGCYVDTTCTSGDCR